MCVCSPSSLQAALKQLAKNKVPNMAVLLKSIIHTHADAKAVFKDPTGTEESHWLLFKMCMSLQCSGYKEELK